MAKGKKKDTKGKGKGKEKAQAPKKADTKKNNKVERDIFGRVVGSKISQFYMIALNEPFKHTWQEIAERIKSKNTDWTRGSKLAPIEAAGYLYTTNDDGKVGIKKAK